MSNITYNQNFAQKQSLNLSLRLWLPLLQTSLQDLESHIRDISYDNPFLDLKRSSSAYAVSQNSVSNSSSETIEALSISTESLYEKLQDQIKSEIFPTPISQKVAYEIMCDIDENGYFDGDIEEIAEKCEVFKEFVESIRKRFSRLEPSGVGAIDLEESFLFQLDGLDKKIDDELYAFTVKMINNLTKMDKYVKHHRFEEARDIIKKFSNPPAIEYMSSSNAVIPDFFITVADDIEVKSNSSYYPDISVKDAFSSANADAKEKLKEARDIVNLLEMRKSTLYRIVLLIVERQISFFVGGELKPLSMQEIADELSFAESTISRAVSNKYIECSIGVFPLKHFFTNELATKGLSSSEVKSFIENLVEYEDKDEPLTDQDLLEKIESRFGIQMVRRTITKYRKLLDMPSSKERKKIYKVRAA
jgi:RNA polymerase sigma-54 factor